MESAVELGIHTLPLDDWSGQGAQPEWQEALEAGGVLYCPELAFALAPAETRFLSERYSDDRRKSIYIRADRPGLFGTDATGQDRADLEAMLGRYRDHALALLGALFPGFQAHMRPTGTSFRPRPTGQHEKSLSWRKDDTRLHVDAFPSNPTRGLRILRVFSNVGSAPRVWRVGEPFEAMARHFLPKVPPAWPLSAALLALLKITKRPRSPYDHVMLHLHDLAKADLDYQRACAQVTFPFAPGSTWICFSDQVMHAAMSGQFMMEQTIQLPRAALAHPERDPVAVLERLLDRPLLAA